FPSGPARELRVARAESLTDKSRGGGRKSEAGQKRQRQDSYSDEICGDFLGAVARDESDVGNEAELDQQLFDGGGIADAENSPAEAEVGRQPLPSEVEHHPLDRQRIEKQNPAESDREQGRHGRAVHA